LQQTKAVNNFPEKLRQAMHEKRCKSVDVSKGTGINPSVLSRYLSGANKPSSDNIIAISHYLNVSPEWLLSSSEASESIQKSQVISSATEPLLKTIEVQDKLIKNLENEVARLKEKVKEWEDWKASSKERHAKGKAKADLAIAKNKNTLRINTTRKRKK
jgi:transcriptional regulator with XRE-family HTH domain